MHPIIIVEELLNSGALVLNLFVMLCRIQTQRSINTWESNVVSILWEVDVNRIVHGKLIDWIDSIFYNFLNDLHALDVVKDGDAAVEAGKQDILFERMRFHNASVVFDFFTETTSFIKVLNYLTRKSVINFNLHSSNRFISRLLPRIQFFFFWFLARFDTHGAESVSAILAPLYVINLTFEEIRFWNELVD